MSEMTISVTGMNCSHCKMNVEKGLKNIRGVDTALANIATGEVILSGQDIALNEVKMVVENLGYTYIGKV